MEIVRNTVLFDCFGVLTTDSWRVFLDGLPEDIDKSQLSDLNRQLDMGWLEKNDFKQQVFELTGAQPHEVEQSLTNETVKNLPLLDYIRGLKSQGIKTAIVSNIASDWITRSFLSESEQQLFDDYILSYQVGMAKPDPRIFELACQRLDSDPSSTVMVDDSERHCAAASSLGMAAIVYTNFESFKSQVDKLLSGQSE